MLLLSVLPLPDTATIAAPAKNKADPCGTARFMEWAHYTDFPGRRKENYKEFERV
jgi:hypothetical protein